MEGSPSPGNSGSELYLACWQGTRPRCRLGQERRPALVMLATPSCAPTPVPPGRPEGAAYTLLPDLCLAPRDEKSERSSHVKALPLLCVFLAFCMPATNAFHPLPPHLPLSVEDVLGNFQPSALFRKRTVRPVLGSTQRIDESMILGGGCGVCGDQSSRRHVRRGWPVLGQL